MPPYRANRRVPTQQGGAMQRPSSAPGVIDAIVGGTSKLIEQAYLREEKKKQDAKEQQLEAERQQDRKNALEDRDRQHAREDEAAARDTEKLALDREKGEHDRAIADAKLKADGFIPGETRVTNPGKVDLQAAVGPAKLQGPNISEAYGTPPQPRRRVATGLELETTEGRFDYKLSQAYQKSEDDHKKDLELQELRNADGTPNLAALNNPQIRAARELRAVEAQIDDTRTELAALERQKPPTPNVYDLEDADKGIKVESVERYRAAMNAWEPEQQRLRARADSLNKVRDGVAARVQGRSAPAVTTPPAKQSSPPKGGKPAPTVIPGPKGEPSDSLLLALSKTHKGDMAKIRADLKARGFTVR